MDNIGFLLLVVAGFVVIVISQCTSSESDIANKRALGQEIVHVIDTKQTEGLRAMYCTGFRDTHNANYKRLCEKGME